MAYYVYILASKPKGTLYIGFTGNLARRVWQHREGVADSFSRKYAVHRLVYAETFADVNIARQRERSLKRWLRAWKIELIEKENPTWRDLYDDLLR
ncbi:MAG: GIY-YIG nuclease family protein [Alphaproteobacteria bacterium]|nr:GIY-YIG nuclease family protein [Alphaproteobacteria bacterium]